MEPVKVLIVDDSAFVRKALSGVFEAEGLKVVGEASDPYEARTMILKYHPDILTLDLEMPRMDGLTFLERLMTHRPMPVVIFSSFTGKNSALALKALELGAVEVLEKPTNGHFGPGMVHLVRVLKETCHAKPRRKRSHFNNPAMDKKALGEPSRLITALGASTGGTETLSEILRALPAIHPGLVIVQHMPPVFTKTFAERLDRECALKVKEAEEGDVIRGGLALIAPGGKHMLVDETGGKFRVSCPQGPPVNHCRPSVDVLFQSVAHVAGNRAVGVILTGMGQDGADGLLAMRKKGAPTLAQDEESCVVYGMPKEAVARGAVDESVPLMKLAEVLQDKVKGVLAELEGRKS
jgi:two-component system chemotaxis response regulator CheB